MKAYNEAWIYNRTIIDQAERWYRKRLLSDKQIAAVRQAYPVDFRQTNAFIEIGLFLFTTVAILGSYLLPASFFSMLLNNQTVYGLFNSAFGVVVGIVGHQLINKRSLYRNGIDNAFVVTLAGFLAFGFNQLLPNGLSISTHCLLTLPLLLTVLWYYGDTLIAFFTLATFYTFVFDGLLQFSWGRGALPFVMMTVSGLLYFLARNPNLLWSKSPIREAYYADPQNLVQWVTLIVLAASGNYFVVRELNGLLLKPSPAHAPEIDLSFLFWTLTFAIPITYLWQGLQKKDRMLLILGVLGLIAGVMTFHDYFALVPLNMALTIGGLTLIGLAVLGIRYFRQPKHGFTDAPDDDSPDEFFVNTEALTAIQATANTHHNTNDDVRFGGGSFGGAGSEGKY
ncbi:hypothetical protein G8759_28895 [Spirosoma aureum]|uniref:DUF2157 domain-containing protein n=1 Tax=Spirosoma aureum TaxID=2692134 RepID=A0A6G9AVY4_9BACT|nr:hypothetical protein [Spirosoma aureum]QIP16373.1 hypothetical protein G8759_28895 [Spirosoma aureum]